MIKVLNKEHNIVLVEQDIIPEPLRGREMIQFMDKRNMVVISGWGELTEEIAKIIVEYLGLSPEKQEEMGEHVLSAGDKCVIELNRALKEIARLRRRQEERNNTMKIDDIKIYPRFAASLPRQEKMERKRAYYQRTGGFESSIVLDVTGSLIDGYTTYLLAKENGLESVPVKYGRRQIIKAVHKAGDKAYSWELPGILVDHVHVGDKVIVETSRGRRTVRVTAIEEYGQQDTEALRMAVRVKRRATA